MKSRIAAFAVILALALVATAQAQVREIGSLGGSATPSAACPSSCSVIARVTGYQAQVGSLKSAYVIPQAGRIVAFTVELGNPTPKQVSYFKANFGGAPELRLSVLKPTTGHALRLVSQSEIFDLSAYLGSTPTFALASSLNAPAGSVVALTTPTWAPAFATNRPSNEAWRSFRTNCKNYTQPALQETTTPAYSYACVYKGARLLYSATFVPNPTPTKRPSSNGGHGTTGQTTARG